MDRWIDRQNQGLISGYRRRGWRKQKKVEMDRLEAVTGGKTFSLIGYYLIGVIEITFFNWLRFRLIDLSTDLFID